MGFFQDIGRGLAKFGSNVKDEAGRLGQRKVFGVSVKGGLNAAANPGGLLRQAVVDPQGFKSDLTAGARNAAVIVPGVNALSAAGAPGFASTVTNAPALPGVGTISGAANGTLQPITPGVGGVPDAINATNIGMGGVPAPSGGFIGAAKGVAGKVGGLLKDYPGAISGALDEFGSGGELRRAQTRRLEEDAATSEEERARRKAQDKAMEPIRQALMLQIAKQTGAPRAAPARNPYSGG